MLVIMHAGFLWKERLLQLQNPKSDQGNVRHKTGHAALGWKFQPRPEVCQDGMVVSLRGSVELQEHVVTTCPMYHDLREKYGDLGNNSNLAAFFKEALARRDTHDKEQKEKE